MKEFTIFKKVTAEGTTYVEAAQNTASWGTFNLWAFLFTGWWALLGKHWKAFGIVCSAVCVTILMTFVMEGSGSSDNVITTLWLASSIALRVYLGYNANSWKLETLAKLRSGYSKEATISAFSKKEAKQIYAASLAS